MKSVTIITLVVAFVVAGNSKLTSQLPDLKYCQSKTGVTEVHLGNVVSNFMNGVSEIRVRYCLIACLSKRIKAIDNENKLNFTRIEELGKNVSEKQITLYKKIYDGLKSCSLKVKDHRDECSVVEYLMQCTMHLVKNHKNAANIAKEYGKQ
ncbi:hypothetical protein CBL_09596 [Carabus blaptoides fortunei]